MSELHKFIFEGMPVRGVMVRLSDTWRELLQRRALSTDPNAHGDTHGDAKGDATTSLSYPVPAQNLLGEMTAAALLMQSNIKFEGALVLQVLAGDKQGRLKDESAIKLAVVEVRSDLSYRSTLKIVGDIPDDATFAQMMNASGRSRCAITLDPENKFPGQQPYQGIVPLNGDTGESLTSFAEVLEHYMLQSEQLDTKLILAANDQVAAGLLIQRLPVAGENNLAGAMTSEANEDAIGRNEDYNRIALLSASLKREELLTLSVDEILYRLFWNEPIQRFEPQQPAPRFHCTCSRDKVAQTIRSLGQSEAERVIEERDGIRVNCDFCGQNYSFDPIDVTMLFRDPPSDIVQILQ